MRISIFALLSAVCVGAGVLGGDAAAQNFTTLYSFPGSPGANPNGLVFYNGLWFGTTATGGTNGDGTLFQFNEHTASLTLIHSVGDQDGVYPSGNLLLAGNTLYGATEQCVCGGAEVFSFDADTNLFAPVVFTQGSDSSYLYSPLTLADGVLFGTASLPSYGSVFKVDIAAGQYSLAYTFLTQATGEVPAPGLTSVGGALYGATSRGGANDRGAIFALNPTTSAYSVVYSFPHGKDFGPNAPLTLHKNMLYGATIPPRSRNPKTFGAVFKFDPVTQKLKTLYNFQGGTDGGSPDGLIFMGSALYGTTHDGGSAGCGTIFQLNPKSGAKTTLYSFHGKPEGCYPNGILAVRNGSVYGLTAGGDSAAGTIFKFTP